MDVAALASTMVQQQAALTQQQIAIAVQKQTMEAQSSVADLLTASVSNGPSANSAITGRGQVLDISV